MNNDYKSKKAETRQKKLAGAVAILEQQKQRDLALARKGDDKGGCLLTLVAPVSAISLLAFGISYFG